jgi:ISPpu13, transposase orf3
VHWNLKTTGRFWKGYDFDLLNSLHEQGLISQPWGKAKSAYITPEGLERRDF